MVLNVFFFLVRRNFYLVQSPWGRTFIFMWSTLERSGGVSEYSRLLVLNLKKKTSTSCAPDTNVSLLSGRAGDRVCEREPRSLRRPLDDVREGSVLSGLRGLKKGLIWFRLSEGGKKNCSLDSSTDCSKQLGGESALRLIFTGLSEERIVAGKWKWNDKIWIKVVLRCLEKFENNSDGSFLVK